MNHQFCDCETTVPGSGGYGCLDCGRDIEVKWPIADHYGNELGYLVFKPDVGDIYKHTKSGKWHKITFVNNHQEWASCIEVDENGNKVPLEEEDDQIKDEVTCEVINSDVFDAYEVGKIIGVARKHLDEMIVNGYVRVVGSDD